MNLIASRELWQRVKRTQWRYQVTCSTPTGNLSAFASCVVDALHPLREASLLIHLLIDAPAISAACADAFTLDGCGAHCEIQTDSEAELLRLLEAACTDMIDFYLVPVPKRFLMFCDHDNFITFFANTKSHLSGVTERLKRIPVTFEDYERQFP